jgi:hypothetical protein
MEGALPIPLGDFFECFTIGHPPSTFRQMGNFTYEGNRNEENWQFETPN